MDRVRNRLKFVDKTLGRLLSFTEVRLSLYIKLLITQTKSQWEDIKYQNDVVNVFKNK
jgi:hypothetical protein